MEAAKLMRQCKVDLLKQVPQSHQQLFKWFFALTELHRPSFETKEAMATVKGWFESMGATSNMDDYGNCIFSIPGTKGKENVKPICIQGHLDMVAVGKFEEGGKVPLKIVDGWLTSGVSSIGADDGIAVATMLAICENKDKFEHGPIEFLTTVDEEVGLFGATKLPGPPFIKSRALLNLDSEEWGYFTTSCAGGINIFYEYDVSRADYKGETLKITVSDFVSGHSGCLIHEGRANAVKWMARLLEEGLQVADFRLVSINGGEKHNVIPDLCEAVVVTEKVAELKAVMEKVHGQALNEYKTIEVNHPKIKFETVAAQQPMTEADTLKVLDFITSVYHGVWMMHPEMKSLVNTSQCLSVTKVEGNHLFIQVFARTNEATQMQWIVNTARALGRLAGINCRIPEDEMVGPWPAALSSRIMDVALDVYQKLYNSKPVITGIHAGLECGAIQNRGYPDLEAISFGPDLFGAHTINEKTSIETCCKCYDLTIETLKEWAQ